MPGRDPRQRPVVKAMSRFSFGLTALMATLCLATGAIAAEPEPRHGFAILGELKYPTDFTHFDYVDPEALKGGEIVLWYQGTTFDSLNPFILKGVPAAGSNPFLPGGSLLTFQSLMIRTMDEPDSYYGLIAEAVVLPQDKSWMEFALRPEATWHDGSAITAADVVFSFETLKSKGNPLYRILFRDVVETRALGPKQVRFVFRAGVPTRDLPGHVAGMPILSKVYYEAHEFEKASLTPPLASGIYRIAKVDPPRTITYERVKGHWAENLSVNKGRFNFDRIRFDYYRDRDISLQALFGGKVDFRESFTSKDWATKYDVPPVHDGRVKRETLPDETPSGTQAFLLNTRREKFADPRVRHALNYAFDFEWTNKNIFYSLYERTKSIFENSKLAARGAPSAAELAMLQPYRDRLPAKLFETAYVLPATDGSGNNRGQLRQARKLLRQAGWRIKDGHLVNGKGEVFEVEFLSALKGFERVILPYIQNLERLGIKGRFRLVESAQYQRRIQTFEFDVITSRFGGTLTPGVNLRNVWGSAAADVEGSRNYTGLKDPVVDALIEKVIAATTRKDLITATQALDRVVMWGHYLVPQWYKASHNVAYWDKFGRPTVKPKYALGFLDTWWIDPAKAAALAAR